MATLKDAATRRSRSKKADKVAVNFAEPESRQGLDINTEVGGQLAVVEPTESVEAEVVDGNSNSALGRYGSNTQLANREANAQKMEGLLEKCSQLVSSFLVKAEDRLGATQVAMEQLLSGEMSIDELASQYGEMSIDEMESKKAQLARVYNSMEVTLEQLGVERKGIEVNHKKASNVLFGLRKAFELQEEAEKTADAQDQANYQADVRSQNNVARNQDMDYRISKNALDNEDKQSRIAHMGHMNQLGERFRSAIQRGYEADVKLKEAKTDAKTTKVNRILEAYRKGVKGHELD